MAIGVWVFLATALSWVYGRAFAPDSRWRVANLVPVLGALFDYLENASTSLVLLVGLAIAAWRWSKKRMGQAKQDGI